MKVYKEFIRSHLPEELVDKANYNGNQFPTFEILRCDYLV